MSLQSYQVFLQCLELEELVLHKLLIGKMTINLIWGGDDSSFAEVYLKYSMDIEVDVHLII